MMNVVCEVWCMVCDIFLVASACVVCTVGKKKCVDVEDEYRNCVW